MRTIRDVIAGEQIRFHLVEDKRDLRKVRDFIWSSATLGMDTESTGVNPYRVGWELRTAQYGDDVDSYVVPARYRSFIGWVFKQEINWVGHNGTHDVRSVDVHLGYDTGVVFAGETYIPAHHHDSRKKDEGGVGHGLKAQAEAYIDRNAGRWETELKKVFKEILIPLPGEVYKSGPKKGTQKFRKAKIGEGWALVDPTHPAYVAYAAADPILTYRLWRHYQSVVRAQHELYRFDKLTDANVDRLQRRAIRLDVDYTRKLSRAYARKAAKMVARASDIAGWDINIQSGQQLVRALTDLGVTLTERTDKGQFKTDAAVLRAVLDDPYSTGKVRDFVHCVLVAKQVIKRRESYTESMLREMDSNGRVHPSINALAARTARMSVSGPPLQQLPTKDREDEVLWESEETL